MAAADFHQQFNFKDHRSVCALPLLSPYLTPFSSVLSLSFMGSVCVLECVCVLSCVQLFCDPMDCQTSLSTGFSGQRILEWVAIPFSRGSSNRGIEPMSPAVSGDSLPLGHLGSPCDSDFSSILANREQEAPHHWPFLRLLYWNCNVSFLLTHYTDEMNLS